VALANALSGRVLRDGFAVLLLLVAAQFVRRALASGARRPAAAGAVDSPGGEKG
jgi:uncharacterized membrane protein YfcA